MSVFGIVSEFNPFHNGHEYLIKRAKELGADTVVCAMSGNATQRGELSVVDKYERAEAAISGGADLILELPFPWSSASAESFALAGIHVLSSFCDTVIFGSESGDIELLKKVADYTLSDDFKKNYNYFLESGEQSASVYISLIKREFGVQLASNELLGVEYIKAAKKLGFDLNFVTVKREGSAFRQKDMTKGSFDSAMAIRNVLEKCVDIELVKDSVPERSYELLLKAKRNGEITEQNKFGEFAIMHYRLFEKNTEEDFAECEGGIFERIQNTARSCEMPSDFWYLLSTKRYTDAKLRRAVLFGMCGVHPEDVFAPSLPAYTLLLAANEQGRELLSSTKRKGERITVVTKPADAFELPDEAAKRQAQLSSKLDMIFGLCRGIPTSPGSYIKKKPYIT